jgi:hypothetical protein
MTLDATAIQPPMAVVEVEESGIFSVALKALVYRAPTTAVAVVPPTPLPPVATPVPVAPTPTVMVAVATPIPAPTNTSIPVPVSALTYEQVCEVDESNMTDPQLAAHAAQFTGQPFTNWRGWVYDVVDMGNGQYNLEIAMEERGLFWSRDLVVENLPTNLATSLNVEQPIMFDGHIARLEYTFETMCNPMVVDNFTLK